MVRDAIGGEMDLQHGNDGGIAIILQKHTKEREGQMARDGFDPFRDSGVQKIK